MKKSLVKSGDEYFRGKILHFHDEYWGFCSLPKCNQMKSFYSPAPCAYARARFAHGNNRGVSMQKKHLSFIYFALNIQCRFGRPFTLWIRSVVGALVHCKHNTHGICMNSSPMACRVCETRVCAPVHCLYALVVCSTANCSETFACAHVQRRPPPFFLLLLNACVFNGISPLPLASTTMMMDTKFTVFHCYNERIERRFKYFHLGIMAIFGIHSRT